MKRLSTILLLAILCLSFAGSAFAQPPDSLWGRIYTGTEKEYGHSVQQTLNGGFIICGSTFSQDDTDIYLLRVDSMGDTLWTRTYGGTEYDTGNSVIQTPDEGFIIVGSTASFGAGLEDVYLLKIDSMGNVLWSRTYGGSESDMGYSFIQTSDEGFIIVGFTESFGANYSDVYIIKTNNLGDTLWTNAIHGSNYFSGRSIQETSDGGYIIAGNTSRFPQGSSDVYLLKINELGERQWSRTYGRSSMDYGSSVIQTFDGGYVIAGTSYNQASSIFGIRTDSLGDTLWTRTYGGMGYFSFGSSVHLTADGGYLFSGETRWPIERGFDFYLIKVDSMGDTLWSETYGGNEFDRGGYSQQIDENEFILVGSTDPIGDDMGDILLIRLGELTGTDKDDITTLPYDLILSQNYPNPFNASTMIGYELPRQSQLTINIYDILGRRVETMIQGEQQAGYHQVVWDAEDASSGMYFYRIQAGDYVETRKMVLLK